MKNIITICLLAFICAFSISSLSAQEKKTTKQVIVIEKTVDENGNISESKVIKEGEEAEMYIKAMDVEGDDKERVMEKEVRVRVKSGDHKNIEKELYKFVIVDDEGNEKVLEWNGEGEMPEEMEEMMEDHDFDIHESHESKVIIMKSEGDDEDIFEFELEDGDLSPEMQEMLKKHGVDIEMLKDEDGNIEVIVETEGYDKNNNKAQLGVYVENDDNGAKIIGFMDDAAALKAGLEEGDIITAVNDVDVSDIESLVESLSSFKPNDIITINYLRGSDKGSKEITLQERSAEVKHKVWKEVVKEEKVKDGKVKKEKKIIIKEK